MTAPDRIWLPLEMEWVRCQICKGSGGGQQMAFDHDFTDAVEYIRKGAFPVEELREALDDRYGPETAVAFRAEYKLMERILSLLEDSE